MNKKSSVCVNGFVSVYCSKENNNSTTFAKTHPHSKMHATESFNGIN